MAQVVVSPAAQMDLRTLIQTHSLPTSTIPRFRRCIEPFRDFPELGAQLHGRWSAFRFILGPWRWMIIVYHHDPEADRVAVVTIQDGRGASAPRTQP